jgi:hypothetical protein
MTLRMEQMQFRHKYVLIVRVPAAAPLANLD